MIWYDTTYVVVWEKTVHVLREKNMLRSVRFAIPHFHLLRLFVPFGFSQSRCLAHRVVPQKTNCFWDCVLEERHTSHLSVELQIHFRRPDQVIGNLQHSSRLVPGITPDTTQGTSQGRQKTGRLIFRHTIPLRLCRTPVGSLQYYKGASPRPADACLRLRVHPLWSRM